MTQEHPEEQRPAEIPPPPPPLPVAPGRGYYSGPWPPEGTQPRREGFWSIVWRTATRTSVIAAVGGMAFVVGMLAFFGVIAAIVAAVTDDEGDPDALDLEFAYGTRDAEAKLLLVRVDGVILGERSASSLFDSGNVYGYEIKDQLRKAAADDSIDGVLLYMSTPGGTIYGSQAIADGVTTYQQETGKPVLAFVAGLSASGGVWSMAPADRILADRGSLTGSIGVIMGPFEHYDGVVATEGGLLGGGITTTNGITVEYLTAGRSKDFGNPFRPLTSEERAVMQTGLDAIYGEFVEHVSSSREIPAARIRNEMGALIFDNATAERYGLIDGSASLEGAYAQLAEMAGLADGAWRVMQVEDGGGLFGSLLEGDISPATAEYLAGLQPSGCLARGTMLAYHGDPAALCWR